MSTSEPITPPAEAPTLGARLGETIPLVDASAGYGPRVNFIAGPWLLLAVVLSAPVAVLVTLIAVMVLAATVVVALTAAIVVASYRPVRQLSRHRAGRARIEARTARVVAVGSRRVRA
jgi:hypothetical protein